jgi:hypothetical protein
VRATNRLNHLEINTGRELAPAFTLTMNRLLWRRRARPSATLDKILAKLLMTLIYEVAPRAVKTHRTLQPLLEIILDRALTLPAAPHELAVETTPPTTRASRSGSPISIVQAFDLVIRNGSISGRAESLRFYSHCLEFV